MDLLTLQQKQYISIPGEHNDFEINCIGLIPPEISHIYITLHFETYTDGFRYTPLEFCHYFKYMYCLKFMKNNMEYIIYGNISNYYQNINIDEKIHFSWLNGNQLCKQMGYQLPYFVSRDELDDLIHILHGADSIPYIEAIFIGLSYNQHKVSS